MSKRTARTLPPPAGALPGELEQISPADPAEDRERPDKAEADRGDVPPPAPPAVAVPPAIDQVQILVPVADPEPGYQGLHVDVRLEHAQAQILNRVVRALSLQHAQLANGRHVEGRGDAVRWLVEAIGRSLPESAD